MRRGKELVDPFRAGAAAGTHHARASAAAIIVAAALTGGACSPGSDEDPKQLPSSPPLTVPSQSTPSSGSAAPAPGREAVISAYHRYWDASVQAARSPESQVRQVLAPVSTPGVIDDQLRAIRQMKAKHREPWGRGKIHVYAVDVNGKTARLSDCQDVSQAGLADSRTHQLIPGTRGGTRPVNFSVRLQQGPDNQWRVSAVRAMEAPCTLPSSPS